MSDYEEMDRFVPGDPQDPHGDKATLDQLQAHGADLTKTTNFIHFIAFPDEDRARRGGREIAEKLGYGVRGRPPAEPGGSWLVSAERDQVPTLENIDRMRRALTLIADEFDGDYDGWEAALTR